jgi:cob(I)alamin adenosyltransferase
VDAYGCIDELNAVLGLAGAACDGQGEVPARLREILLVVQSRLFDIGADLATPAESKHELKIARITAEQTAEVEAWIDEIDAGNEPMQHFILPGGTPLAAHLHHARTVCRRAERAIVQLSHAEPIGEAVLTYVNRLSDLLFALARRANRDAGVDDVPWRGSEP